MEASVHFTAAPGTTQYAFISQWVNGFTLSFVFSINGGNLSFFYSTNGSTSAGSVTGAWSPAINTWYDIAVDRDVSNVLRLYINGAVVGSATVAGTIFNSNALLSIGGGGSGGFPGHAGYIDEVRITKGAARYAGAYTPATSAFPNS